MKKRLALLFCVLIIVIAVFSTKAQAAERFLDVHEEDWFYEDVRFVADQGIMTGMTEEMFGPAVSTARAMIVTILYRLDGSPETEGSSFADVEKDSWYDKPVAWAQEKGIVSGYNAVSFGPADSVTREQLAVILFRYAGYKGFDNGQDGLSEEHSDEYDTLEMGHTAESFMGQYQDAADVSDWAREAMAWAVSNRIITGMDSGFLNPQGEAARAQVAAVFHRFLNYLHGETVDYPPEETLKYEVGSRVDPGSDSSSYFQIYEISDEVFSSMTGRSFTEGGVIQRSDLRYLRVLYRDYNDDTRIGELVVNAAVAERFLAVMRELYEAGYQINKMELIDRYYDGIAADDPKRGDKADEASIADNNTSAFNYRPASNDASILSNHARGFAIDLNPYENPYVFADGTADGPDGCEIYADRSGAEENPHMISDGDTAVSVFKKHGFIWGGDWPGDKDYQHFEIDNIVTLSE